MQRFEAEIENELFRALGLAPGRQHAAREIGTAKTRTFAPLDHFDMRAPPGRNSKATVRPATPGA